MGLTWSNSYNKDPLVRHLWKQLRAVPVLPITPSLDVLQVLAKRGDGFVIVGNVASVSVVGDDKTWLEGLIRTRDKSYFKRPTLLGAMKTTVSKSVGGFVDLLVGEVGAKVELTKANLLDISVPRHAISGVLPGEKWEEVMERFKPNMNLATMGPFSLRGKVDLFIVQEVIKVPYIEIKAADNVQGGLQGAAPAGTFPIQNRAGLKIRKTKDGKYLLKSSNKKMMPVAFRGLIYTYDRSGRREKRARPTKFLPDSAPDDVGASTSAPVAPVEDPEIAAEQAEDEDEDDDPQTDENMRWFLDDNGWYATILHPNQTNIEIFPPVNEAEGEEEEEEEEEELDAEEPSQ